MEATTASLFDGMQLDTGNSTSTETNPNIANMNGNEVVRSQAALAEPQQMQESPRPHLKRVDIPTLQTNSMFMDKFSPEIRSEIYKRLLLRRGLAQPMDILDEETKLASVKYRIDTGILYTCKHIYQEASCVLYELNTFAVRCFDDHYPGVIQTPVTRYENGYDLDALERALATAKVRNWKVFVFGRQCIDYRKYCSNLGLLLFCRAISSNRTTSLRVSLSLAQIGADRSVVKSTWGNTSLPSKNRMHDVTDILLPLRQLRNVKTFEIEEDLPTPASIVNANRWPHLRTLPRRKLKLSEAFKTYLKQLVQGDEPVDRLLKMYRPLLQYARAFERNPRFKLEMDGAYGQERTRMHLKVENITTNFLLDVLHQDPFPIQSPFKQGKGHCVENALEAASLASEEYKPRKFKRQRRLALEYLEVQYKRSMAAFAELRKYIESEKKSGGFFDPHWISLGHNYPSFSKFDYTKALVVLQKVNKAFERDFEIDSLLAMSLKKDGNEFSLDTTIPSVLRVCPTEISTRQTRRSRKEDQTPVATPPVLLARESTLAHLKKNLDGMDHCKFVGDFKAVVTDIENQYFEIRNARKALFDFDSSDIGCDLVDTPGLEDRINWDVVVSRYASTLGEGTEEPSWVAHVDEGDDGWYSL
ncbi:hypothetical protein B7494_g3048 [Chlorociboria aeruginascens]|nr:hypothetical protein B7494_g3048 [Chlorociboria aeruginascens]